jgi:hypothetical protein
MQERYGEAEKRFQESYALAKALGEIRFQLDNIDYLAQICIMQDRDSLAGYYLNEGENLISKNASFNLEKIKIYSRLAQLNIKSRNFEKASNYQLKHSQLKENVYSEEMTNSLMKAEASFMERENATKILMQKHLIGLKEEILQRQAFLNKISAALIVICVGFVMVLYRIYQQKKILNGLLNKKIAERTKELQVSRDDLVQTFRRRDMMADNMLREVTKALGTIKGLCLVGMKEVTDPAARRCIERIDTTAGELRRNLERPSQDSPHLN